MPLLIHSGGFALNNNGGEPPPRTPASRLILLGVGSVLALLTRLLGG